MANPLLAVSLILDFSFFKTPKNCWREAVGLIFICQKWKAIWRPGFGMTSLTWLKTSWALLEDQSEPLFSSRPSWRRSRWMRFSTSFGIILPVLTVDAGIISLAVLNGFETTRILSWQIAPS